MDQKFFNDLIQKDLQIAKLLEQIKLLREELEFEKRKSIVRENR
jgi:hypothetical protein